MLPLVVTLSRSEGSIALGVEMLRCSQHDSALLLPRHRPRSPEVAVIVKDLNTNEQHPGTTIDFLLQ